MKLTDKILKEWCLKIPRGFPLLENGKFTCENDLSILKEMINSYLILEARGIYGRESDEVFEHKPTGIKAKFVSVKSYPDPKISNKLRFDNVDERNTKIKDLEDSGKKIDWVNTPNNRLLSFGLIKLAIGDKNFIYWGKYFEQIKPNMFSMWKNNQIPAGWELQIKSSLKEKFPVKPKHLIKTSEIFKNAKDVIDAVSKNSRPDTTDILTTALENAHKGETVVFPGMAEYEEPIRDYFGEIFGPLAMMGGQVKGQANDAKKQLAGGQDWSTMGISWPMNSNTNLIDSSFVSKKGMIGISSKGGKGAKASSSNLYKAYIDVKRAGNVELLNELSDIIPILTIIQSNTIIDGPFRLAEYLRLSISKNLENEIKSYIKNDKRDLDGISPEAKTLISIKKFKYSNSFRTGYALLSVVAKLVADSINNNDNLDFSSKALSLLNNSSIIQLHITTQTKGDDVYVKEYKAIYPPKFTGKIELDGEKSYYSSNASGKIAFGFV